MVETRITGVYRPIQGMSFQVASICWALAGTITSGCPAIEALARDGDPKAVKLPRPLVGSGEPHFSFAGLKGAVQR